MTVVEMRAYIKEIVDEAPPLSDAQRTKLAELLRPVRINRDNITHAQFDTRTEQSGEQKAAA